MGALLVPWLRPVPAEMEPFFTGSNRGRPFCALSEQTDNTSVPIKVRNDMDRPAIVEACAAGWRGSITITLRIYYETVTFLASP
jgi:hypothetical protein